jgi:hypothetical protein
MATTTKALARTAATTNTATTLYTVPSATTTVISSIVLANSAASTSTVTISFDGVVAVPTVSVPANTVIEISLKQVLATTKTITGGASTTAVSIHISGVEIA